MEQWYDTEEDILGVRLEDRDYWKSVELSNGIVIDISKNGNISGLEIPQAKSIFADDVKKVIESAKKSG